MNDWIVLLLFIFAVYRLAQLITLDEISEPMRTHLAKRANKNKLNNWMAILVHCPYCVGIWLSIPVAIFYAYTSTLAMGLVSLFGVAGAQSFLQSLSSSEDN